jgi:hypothetical protein
MKRVKRDIKDKESQIKEYKHRATVAASKKQLIASGAEGSFLNSSVYASPDISPALKLGKDDSLAG